MIRKDPDGKWGTEKKEFIWKDLEHSMVALGETQCLQIFYHASYTPPAGDCVSYQRLCSVPLVIEVRSSFQLLCEGSNPAIRSALKVI